jgi:hypothetical protein
VAMIHSYWFLIARIVFEGVLQQDPNCAIAYWGIAMDQLGNSLVGPPPRAQADAAWAALALEIGAKTERERGWTSAAPQMAKSVPAIRQSYPWKDRGRYEAEIAARLGNDGIEILSSFLASEITALCRRQMDRILDDAAIAELKAAISRTEG